LKKVISVLFLYFSTTLTAQVTGLSDWSIFIDPGHSQNENVGIYNYSEAKKALRIALYLQKLLETKTDISATYLSRTNDQQQVSLSQRTSSANSLGTDWYHSIHSNAGAPSSNSTLLLHGGWRKNGATVEKTPKGGKRMSDIMVDLLTRGMRTTTSGNYADRTFYQGFPDNHTNQYPYLHVNRESNMASELSEGGYHTNPMQNQLNMNADWKKIEAYTVFWTVLKYQGLPRPSVDVVTGIVRDLESGKPVNGAVISIEDTSYVTDTFESLFNQYSSDPNQLANGFYFLDGFEQDSLKITVEAEGFYPQSKTVARIDTFFTYVDFDLISNVPPIVTSTSPVAGDTNVLKFDKIKINFSRPMNTASVEDSFKISPFVEGTFSWSANKKQLTFNTTLDIETEYTVTVTQSAEDNYQHKLDGNKDGIAGDDFVLVFTTGHDIVAPELITAYPISGQEGLGLQPIISYQYDEVIDTFSLNSEPFELIRVDNSEPVPGAFQEYVVNDRTVFNFFPNEKLEPSEIYKSQVQSGLADLFGNETAAIKVIYFKTGDQDINLKSIDNFESNFTGSWWQPSQSGSTTGIKESTGRSAETEIVNFLTTSTKSMRLDYEWDLGSGSWLIREYLSGGAARNVTFDISQKLQVYIFGDGNSTKFRFALDEGTSSSNWTGHEVSTWFTIDWIGWKLVEWDLGNPDLVGNWIGNGKLDKAKYRIDSFQLTYDNSAEKGTIYFDDLRAVKPFMVVGIEQANDNIPKTYGLGQNYPNPFNPVTKIDYTMASTGKVTIDVFNNLGQRVTVLENSFKQAGRYSIFFDGANYAAGNYTIRMRVNNKSFVRKMTLLK
jgi:N-acetylmuramoyl-L-alanine amidase